MKILTSIIVLVISITIISCSKNSDISENPTTENVKLTSISSSKKMAKIEAGTYKAFFGKDSTQNVKVATFYLDESPVTNAEYLKFLKANPQWTKSQVKRIFADSSYLHQWKSDYEIPENANSDAPVTSVSWFAAEAYAKSVGKRLPTLDEWEFAAAADEISKNASEKTEFTDYILKSYQTKQSKTPVKQQKPNYYGIYDLYGKVWEWTYDFNAVMMSGESRKDNTTNETLFCAGASVTSSDLKNYAAFIRFAMRGSVKANYSVNNLGFRCAKDIN